MLREKPTSQKGTEGVVMGAEFFQIPWGLSVSDSWGLSFFSKKKQKHSPSSASANSGLCFWVFLVPLLINTKKTNKTKNTAHHLKTILC